MNRLIYWPHERINNLFMAFNGLGDSEGLHWVSPSPLPVIWAASLCHVLPSTASCHPTGPKPWGKQPCQKPESRSKGRLSSPWCAVSVILSQIRKFNKMFTVLFFFGYGLLQISGWAITWYAAQANLELTNSGSSFLSLLVWLCAPLYLAKCLHWPYHKVQAGLRLVAILLLQALRCWDYRPELSCLAQNV